MCCFLSFRFQNRISTYDFPMFCENEKSIHPTTHTFVSHSKPNISQANSSYGEQLAGQSKVADHRSAASSYIISMDNSREAHISGITSAPLSKSTSLKAFTDRHLAPISVKVQPQPQPQTLSSSNRFENDRTFNAIDKCHASTNSNSNSNTGTAIASTSSLMSTKPFLGRNRCNNKNDSESSSGSDLIDLTSKKKQSVSEMYNDDIDYMNNYLKSLPDYNELNRKISNEQQKCEDIYDRLLCINSSLKSNLLPKSNSYHSICTASTKPYQSISARCDNQSKNKIIRSSSSSIVNQNLINNPDKIGVTPMKSINLMQIRASPNQTIAQTTATAKVQQPSQTKPNNLNEMYKLQNPLPKSASSTSLHRSNSKKGLNDFWSENLAKTNQQKMGWNYNKIMANRAENPAASDNDRNIAITSSKNDSNISAPISGYKLQKNMSLSQLDQRIRQNVSREELYNLMCNNEPTQLPDLIKPTNTTTSNRNKNNISYNNLHKSSDSSAAQKLKQMSSNQLHKQQPMQPMQPTHITPTAHNTPISKSFSQNNMPSFFSHFTKMKSPRKNSIPTLFKPLCKSSSNTHVFNRTYDGPQETFTPKFLVKSSSSSSIFNTPSAHNLIHRTQPTGNTIDKIKNTNNYSSYVQSVTAPAYSNGQNKISKNNELLKTQNKALFHETASSNKQNADNFFIKQTIPPFSKATVNYTKSKSSAHLPIYGNLPSTLSNAVPISSSFNKPNNNSR